MTRRILLLITDLEIGGTPTVVRELAIRLRKPGLVDVEVACLKQWGPVAGQLRDAGVPVTAFGVSRAWELRQAVRRLRTLVRERRIDTVFSLLVHANAVATMASRTLSGVRFLQSVQTIQSRPGWHWWVQRWAHRHAERVVVPSTAIVELASRWSGIPRSKFVVIPNAVDTDAFPRVEVFTGPRIRAGYLGRLDPAKDPGMLLNALEFAAMDDAELHYFGDGPARDSLERRARRIGLADRVTFHGAVARPQDALRQIDVLWLPSSVEGFGLVLIEAMASGVPVAACQGGPSDIITDGVNGFLTDAMCEYRNFAASLHMLRRDPALRQRMIDNALTTVRERFTWDVVLPQYRALLGIS